MSSFAEKLRTLRKQKKLSLKKAALLVGVPESTYREWEYGRQIRGHEPYIKIAKAFNLSVDELFGLKDCSSSLEEEFEKIEILLKSVKSKVFTL